MDSVKGLQEAADASNFANRTTYTCGILITAVVNLVIVCVHPSVGPSVRTCISVTAVIFLNIEHDDGLWSGHDPRHFFVVVVETVWYPRRTDKNVLFPNKILML